MSGLLATFSMVATIIGVADGEILNVCLPDTSNAHCNAPPPKLFDKPSFCDNSCPPPSDLNKGLILGGGIPAIIFIFFSLILCLWLAYKTKRILWTVINSSCAQLALLIFFVSNVFHPTNTALNFLVDWFLVASCASLLAEAIATYLLIRDKPMSTKQGALCVGLGCWGVPLLKSIIVFAVRAEDIKSPCKRYFLVALYDIHVTNIVFITVMLVAIIITNVVAVCFLQGESTKKEKTRRCDAWRRISQCLATSACFSGWVIALLVEGLCSPVDVVFFVFSLFQGVVILGFCIYIVCKPNDECDYSPPWVSIGILRRGR
ncbi:uncharacterized protein LOC121431308 isoform X1 [Lytechinus variegatus]|uniref:uncharacterized protein LOC121431308 isoform X1 n=1 Tax=Lytechinus variegatus TaxID=7654 RepID=UPI001BB1D7E9|nr:uncharacterized protein LOC121431308 isoform X1 [Lytechinus variegatus]